MYRRRWGHGAGWPRFYLSPIAALDGAGAIGGQGAAEGIRMYNLGQAAQALNQTRAGALHDVNVDVIHMMLFDSGDHAPTRTFVDESRIATIGRFFGEDDVLRVGADDCLVRHLWIAAVATIIMKDIDGISILCHLIAKRAATEDIRLAGCTIVNL